MADETPNRNGKDRTLLAFGICAKARKLICGTPLICESLKGRNKPFLVAQASDASENTSKRLHDRCAFYGVRLIRLRADGETLAGAVGKSGKVAAVAVTDEQLCRLVCGTLEREHIL